MKLSRIASGVAVVAAGSLVLAGCSPVEDDSKPQIVENSSINVGWNDPYLAFNSDMINTNASANAIVNYELNAMPFYYNNKPELVSNEKFLKIEKLSDSPLKVKYTLTSDSTWSDGVKIAPADLLLSWVAGTTHVSDDDQIDQENDLNEEGAVKESGKTKNLVLWNTGATKDRNLDLVTEMPEINDEERSITLTYSKPYADWQTAFGGVAVSVHKTMELAFPDKYKVEGDNAAEVGKQAQADFVAAVKSKDKAVLAPFAKSFREDYIFNGDMSSEQLKKKIVTSGAYVLDEIKFGQYVTLKAREDYNWGPKPHYQTITIKAISDPQAQIQALQNGEVDIVSAQPTADLLKQVQGLKQSNTVDFASALEGAFEHVDLQVSNGGSFDPSTYGGDADKARMVREAFLKTIPRQEIVNKLIKPLSPEAAVRNSSLFLPGSGGYKVAVKENGLSAYDEPDIEGAKKLLADAGVSNLKVRLLFAKTNPRRNQEFELMRQSAEKAGITLVNASLEKWGPALSQKPESYDAALFAWASTSLNVGESGANYIEGGANNYYGWKNARIDELFKTLSTTVDEAEQQKILIEVGKLLTENAWTVPLYQFPGIVAWSPKVQGVTPGFLSPSYFWNYWDWKPASA